MKKRTYEASNAAKRQICTVLQELMSQKPLNRITVEDWLLGEIQGTPEELIRFVDQVLRDHVRGAGLRLSQAGPGTAPLLEPDHCAGPVSK